MDQMHVEVERKRVYIQTGSDAISMTVKEWYELEELVTRRLWDAGKELADAERTQHAI